MTGDIDSYIFLQGVVGSTAYGLAHAGSDIDRLGAMAHNTIDMTMLEPMEESIVLKDPDRTYHEAGKLLKLLYSCNPTVTELLWLNEYEVLTGEGTALIHMREDFLSSKRVKAAYLGYATQQFRRLKERGKFNSDINEKRVPKHARHLWRLLHQGYELYAYGNLTIKLPEVLAIQCRAFGEAVAQDHNHANDYMEFFEAKFAGTASALPDKPSERRPLLWLRDLRESMVDA